MHRSTWGGILKFGLLCLSFASVAIPLSRYYLKIDWVGCILIILVGGIKFLSAGKINKSTFLLVLIYFFTTLFISCLHLSIYSHFKLDSFLRSFLQLSLALTLFFLISNIPLRTDDLKKILNFWISIAVIASMLGFMQFISNDLIVDKYLFVPYYENNVISKKIVNDVMASTSWFAEASWFGSFLVVPTLYLLSQIMLVDRNLKSPTIHTYCFLLILIMGLFVSYSLAAQISVFFGFLFLLLFSTITFRSAVKFLIYFSLIVIFLLIIDPDRLELIYFRLIELINDIAHLSPGNTNYGTFTSFYARSYNAYKGIEVFIKNPLFGIGVGQSTDFYDFGFVTLIAEQGLVGTFVYYSFFVSCFFSLLMYKKKKCGEISFVAKFLLVAVSSDYLNGLITHNYFTLQRWFLISLAFAWIYFLDTRIEKSKKSFSQKA